MRNWAIAGALWVVAGVVTALALLVHETEPEAPPPSVHAESVQAEPSTATIPAPRTRARVHVEQPAEQSANVDEEIEPEIDEAKPTEDEDREHGSIERGALSIRLDLRDAATGEHVDVRVELWRIGAPETARWTAGDYRQSTAYGRTDEMRFDALPAGRFRLFVTGLPERAEDPPEFVVDRIDQLVCADLTMPRKLPVRAVLFDENDDRISHATVALRVRSSSSRSARPTWVDKRSRRDGHGYRSMSVGSG